VTDYAAELANEFRTGLPKLLLEQLSSNILCRCLSAITTWKHFECNEIRAAAIGFARRRRVVTAAFGACEFMEPARAFAPFLRGFGACSMTLRDMD
jgi:hypothetical protein